MFTLEPDAQPQAQELRVTRHRPQTIEFHRGAVGKIIQLMRQDPGASLDWNELSRIACISRFHFLRIFQELTNTSPHRFLVALRIESAKRLLFESALSVADIGVRAGYSSAGTFVRIFKSLVGLTPGRLRQFRQELPASELQNLLVNSPYPVSERPPSHYQVDLRAESPFAGMVCFGAFNSAALFDHPVHGAVVQQTSTTQLGLPSPLPGNQVCGVGFVNPGDASAFFLPGHDSVLLGSATVGNSHSIEGTQSVVVNLRRPSLFEPPVLVCLPLLLMKLNNRLAPTRWSQLAQTA
jgi:AraC family transcriptional regulator